MVENVSLRPFGARRGFAWIELLNFIWLASSLAALAMYGLGRYIRHTKPAEAVGSLAAIGYGNAMRQNYMPPALTHCEIKPINSI